MKTKLGLVALTLVSLTACNDDPEMRTFSSPSITPQQFVSALNNVDDKPNDPSILMKPDSLQEGYFVIYDAIDCHYRAVSVEELRQLTYEAYQPSFEGTAGEYRYLEENDLGGLDLGERVDFDEDLSASYGFDVFVGRDTGYAYEDESVTTDVSLMTAETEENQLIEKASQVSFSYQVDFKTAVSLVKIGDEVSSMLKSKNELTAQDREALQANLMELGGVTFDDVVEAAYSQKNKDELLERVSQKIGTDKDNLANKILPELFGL